MNKILEEDIQSIIQNFDMGQFAGSTFLVTGATGLIGKLCVRSLLAARQNIKVIALVRNEQKAREIFGEDEHLHLLVQDINDKISYDGDVDYIIHGASTTSSKDFVEKPVETIYTAFNGTRNILEFAKECHPKAMVYLSSMEVFGQITDDRKLSEKDYGYIDLQNPRSSYSESKRMVENLCVSYALEYGVPTKIARLAQTVGPDFKYDDKRMVVQFARAAIENKDIILLTEGKSKCTPIYLSDAIRGIFVILCNGKNGDIYNLANSNAFASVREIAEMVANEIAGGKIGVKIKIDATTKYPPSYSLNLDTSKLEALGWKASVSLKEMYERLIKSLEESL